MEILILALVIGCLPGAIAQSKGRSFFAWWIYGALLFIVALPHSLMVSNLKAQPRTSTPANGDVEDAADTRACPHCAETIKRAAKVCRYCNRDVEPALPEPAPFF